MDFFSAEFFTTLAAIVLIDIVLAGDNAIVIALAARNLPPAIQKKAIVWGTVGAIVVRILMTLIVVWLLELTGLRLFGGLLLIPIALKLLTDQQSEDGHEVGQVRDFWGAMRTIVVADAFMGLDNVLGVAGAADGNFVLVVLGLLISVPIVVWGSTLILKLVERHPMVVYIGAGALLWTAAKMIISDPLLHGFLAYHSIMKWAVYFVIIGGGLGFGWLLERRRSVIPDASNDDENIV
jgi:YjbE family integral membrane protein